jgi:large subunit ribosomal protein LP1
LKAASVDVEPYWPGLFAKALEGINVKDLITSIGSGVGSGPAPVGGKDFILSFTKNCKYTMFNQFFILASAAPVEAAAAPAEKKKEEKKKEESENESDDDMGFGKLLFLS